jgi:hypothetical protein
LGEELVVGQGQFGQNEKKKKIVFSVKRKDFGIVP